MRDTSRGVMALAVMAHLYERPMHAYEIAMTMRERGLDQTIKLNFGTLYHTVDHLLGAGMIQAQQTDRQGRRPERTVYMLTELGHKRYLSWLRALISQPAKEYSRFQAGLAFIWHLTAEEAVGLLRERIKALEGEAGFSDYLVDALGEKGIAPLAIIEVDYERMQRQAELDWLKRVVDDVESGRLPWNARPASSRARARVAEVSGDK